jgi:hypothetical protein
MELGGWLGFIDLVGKGGMSFGGVLYLLSLLGLGIRKQLRMFEVCIVVSSHACLCDEA